MPNISEMQYGHDAAGIIQYLDEVKTESLQKASDAADNIDGIRAALEATWEGEAREDYIKNLKEDVKKFKAALETLYETFNHEVQNAATEMQNFDRNLIKD